MEIVISYASSISKIIVSRLFDAAGRQIGYLLNYNDNIEALRKQAQELKATRDSLQLKIDAAKRNRETILPDVESWISKVDNVSAEAEKFLEDEGNFSKVAKQKITVVTQLQEDGKFQTLSQPAPPPSSIIIPTVGFSGIFESRESIKNEIIEALKDDKESWELFKELVGMDAENSIRSSIAEDVVAECDGLLIAIVTIASALKNKNEHVWIDAAQQLKKSTPIDIPGMQGSVISSLELSIKHLESEDAKSLFFFCSMFPEDFEIPIEVLVAYGVALRWFKNVETMKDVRHRVHAIVSTLTYSFLLIYGKRWDTMEEYVKLHDVVHDVPKIFCYGEQLTPKLNKVMMDLSSFDEGRWMGNLNSTVEQLFIEEQEKIARKRLIGMNYVSQMQ
ncbi:probable disease resistance protein At5g43730 [Mangifera indica]|uniref:probable disease resistance protein At5g43730 n=1 Tax=Mangifera indica TaxID=29780 RepID=UPI001CFBA565|nr:probable disease resistance protein At5g43730 [Mangifera indica]